MISGKPQEQTIFPAKPGIKSHLFLVFLEKVLRRRQRLGNGCGCLCDVRGLGGCNCCHARVRGWLRMVVLGDGGDHQHAGDENSKNTYTLQIDPPFGECFRTASAPARARTSVPSGFSLESASSIPIRLTFFLPWEIRSPSPCHPSDPLARRIAC